MLGEHRVEHRPDTKLFGAITSELHLGDAPLHHLDTHPPSCDVLRRDDGAAQMKAGGAIAIADGLRDRSKIALRDH